MPLLRVALIALAFTAALLGVAPRTLPVAERDARAEPPTVSPGEAAITTGEDPALGATLPELSAAPRVELLGRPIQRIEIVVSGDRWLDRPSVSSVRPGELLSAESGRRAAREVLATGRFARANAEVFAEGEGAVLRIHVLPRRLIASIQVSGGVLDTADVLEAADVARGGELTTPLLEQVSRRIQRYYAQRGFPAAAVEVRTADTDNPGQVILSIDITSGPPRTVARVIFVIDPRMGQELGELTSSYHVKVGDRIEDSALDTADREFLEELKQAGFLRAELRHAVRNIGPWAYVYLYLEPRQRLLPAFDGNRAFDADQLRDALDLKKAPEGRVEELVERLRRFYIRRGFLDAEVTGVEQGGASDPAHYLLFSIREHPQVRVVRRLFPCLKDEFTPDELGDELEAVLREELPGAELFSPGDPRMVGTLVGGALGGRALPTDVNPLVTYDPEVYERAIKHLRELAHSKGYLNAGIGPVQVLRATCSRRSPAGQCVPEPARVHPKAGCLQDGLGLPQPEPSAPEGLACRPDPAHNIACSPELTLRIPINLGPKTTLYDLAFEGNRALTELAIAAIADLPLGSPVSNVVLDEARGRILESYRKEGYAYAEVRTAVEPSPDRSRARVRFFVTEREQVMVTGFVIKGAKRTDQQLILGRVALRRGRPFRLDLVRRTEERVAAFGTFSSVSVTLEDPDVPQRNKRVVVTVVEQQSQYLEAELGFLSGEGVRFGFEYGNRNIAGQAIALTFRVQLSYLPDFLIFDPALLKGFARLQGGDRIERRISLPLTIPQIGLGPLVSLSLEGAHVRDNQRDYGITKYSFIPTLTFRPTRQVTTQLSASGELNDFTLFNKFRDYQQIVQLRVPEGGSVAVSQRASITWDFRDNPLNATKGALISASVEHVDAYRTGVDTTTSSDATTSSKCKDAGLATTSGGVQSHFIRFAAKASTYIRLPLRVTLALSFGIGYNQQLTCDSETYPDRLFYLGGVNSLRSFLTDNLVPQDLAQDIAAKAKQNPDFQLSGIPIRGGDFFVNPRAELRIPVAELFGSGISLETGLFIDAGNVWTGNVWSHPSDFNPLLLRYAIGVGLRLTTPIGPFAFDYGWNPDPRVEPLALKEDTGAFHFSIGLY